MTDQSFPITPPPELRAQWRKEAPVYRDCGVGREEWLMDRAAQWGWNQRGTINEAQLQERADQELEACLDFVQYEADWNTAEKLRDARRPKPPSLKEQALEGFERILSQLWSPEARKGLEAECQTIHLALEALPND